MRVSAPRSTKNPHRRGAVLGLLPGLFLLLAWACGGCGGGDKEQQDAAAQGSRMVPSGTEHAAGTGTDTGVAPADSALAADQTAVDAPAGGTVAEAEPVHPAETKPAGTKPAATAAAPTQTPTTPAATTDRKPAVQETGNPSGGGEYSLQLGSFRARANAEARAQLVRDTGYAPRIVSAEVGEFTYYRVMIPGLADRSTAERVGAELKDLLGIDYLVKKGG